MSDDQRAALRGGIDLGGTKIEAVVFDADHKPVGSARHPTPITGTPADVAQEMATAMNEAAEQAGIKSSDLAGIGVGSPGSIDAQAGTVSSARNLPGWEGTYALAAELSKALGAPVKLGNDVQVAITAEYKLGAGRPYSSVLGVFWGTGVGGGVIFNGELWRGRGGAGEIGHMVVHRGGRQCPCGNKGCVEAYSGRAAMENEARERIKDGHDSDLPKIMRDKGRPRFTSAVWEKAVEQGDKVATDLIDGAVKALAAGIASACNLLDLEAVIIGGGLGVRFGDPYVERIREAMGNHLFPGHQPPDVHLVGLGDLGGAIGASLLVEPS